MRNSSTLLTTVPTPPVRPADHADRHPAGAGRQPAPAPADQPVLPRRSLARNARLKGFQVLATGSYAPPRRVSNEELQTALGVDGDWVLRRTGIQERRHAPPEMATSDLCYEAAVRCLAAGRVDAADIDLLIVTTMSPDLAAPSTACILQERLGLLCGAFDLHAACSGFVYALATGAQFVRTGNVRRCLVVGGDTCSRITDPADRETYPLFGDGAGAVLLGPASQSDQGFVAYQLGSDGAGAGLLYRQGGGSRLPADGSVGAPQHQYMKMEGRAIFRWVVQTVAEATGQLLDYAGMTAAEIGLFVPHQANLRIVAALAERLGLAPARVYTNLQRYGNTIAASVPLALDEAVNEGRVRRGDLLLLTGFGAGLTWASALLRW
ncbi:MAG: ketoacyl-ACP synthase III [Gemmataceae bacterium]|nr:ketoacyl-ACP synthase III [Gemmataceae bacterium]